LLRVRRKALWLELEQNGDAEFECYLAVKLGRTLEELGTMSNAEFVRWWVYFGRIAQRKELETKRAKG
jgi:hypothetical protein